MGKLYRPAKKETRGKINHPVILEAINCYILSHPFASVKDTQEMIKNQFQISCSSELIRLAIIKNNFTKKRAKYFSIPKNDEQKLNDFLIKRKKYVSENRIFVSLDETSFGRNYLPAIGYSKKGEKLRIKRPFIHMTTQSVVAAVSPRYKIKYFKKNGSFNTESYCDFLEQLEYPKNTVLVMDNVSFHHSRKVLEILKSREWGVLFVPPYSPVFNPIEGVFSIVKRHYQKFMNIEKAFDSITDDNIVSFFRGSFKATKRF